MSSNISDVANFQNLDDAFLYAFGDRAREIARKAREQAERLANQAREAKARADKMAKDALNSTNQAIKDSAKRASDDAKKLAEKAKEASKKAISETKKADKKIKKSLKNIVGKARKAYKKMLRRQILSAVYLSIRANRHGIATRLYPAIISDSQAKGFKYKSSFIPKSKKSYQQVLKQWTDLGGKKSKLDDAIAKGARLRVFKFKKRVSNIDGVVVENKDIIIGNTEFHVLYHNFGANDSAINHALNEYYSGIDANGDGLDDETGMPVETAESASVSEETLSAEENAILAEEGAENTDTEEKESGFQSFIAMILSIFKRNDAEEIPYEAGVDATNYGADMNTDSQYQPSSDSSGENTIDGLNVNEKDPLEDKNAKIEDIPELIWGVDSRIIYTIGGVLAGVGVGLGIAYATKQNKLLFASIGAVALGAVGFFTPKFIKKASSSEEEEEKSNFTKEGGYKKKKCWCAGSHGMEQCPCGGHHLTTFSLDDDRYNIGKFGMKLGEDKSNISGKKGKQSERGGSNKTGYDTGKCCCQKDCRVQSDACCGGKYDRN